MSHVSAVLLVLLAGTMWAASGTAAQDFYAQSHHLPVELTQVRLFLSSGLFFLLAWWSGGLQRGVRTLRHSPRLLLRMAVHGILGIMIVQFSYFKGIAGGDDTKDGGNKEKILSRLVQTQAIPAAAAVMVGDRAYDICAANALGIAGVGVTYGYGSRKELEKAGATHIVSSIDALTDLLLRDL